jgi:hypothetical protein
MIKGLESTITEVVPSGPLLALRQVLIPPRLLYDQVSIHICDKKSTSTGSPTATGKTSGTRYGPVIYCAKAFENFGCDLFSKFGAAAVVGLALFTALL